MRSFDLLNGRTAEDSEGPGISRTRLRRSRRKIERIFAWFVLILGLFGSLVASQGGWANVAAFRFQWAAGVLILLIQGILTWIQWSYDDVPLLARPARGVDALLTLAGLGPLLISGMAWIVGGALGFLVWFASTFGLALAYDPAWATAGGWLLLIVAAVGAAWYPEHTLVK